jgi:hypothetical protein
MPMQFMAIERFRAGAKPVCAPPVFQRASGCVFQCDDLTLPQRWVAAWEHLTGFEIVPVVPGASAVADAVLGS